MLPSSFLSFLVVFAMCVSAPKVHAQYQPPEPEVLLFRRENIPIDADRQKELSDLLLTLINRPSAMGSAEDRRANAQLISLARQLNPSSTKVVSANRKQSKGIAGEASPARERLERLQRIERFVLYLLEKKSVGDSKKLAELIIDPLAVVAPALPVVVLRDSTSVDERWRDAIAPLAKFR